MVKEQCTGESEQIEWAANEMMAKQTSLLANLSKEHFRLSAVLLSLAIFVTVEVAAFLCSTTRPNPTAPTMKRGSDSSDLSSAPASDEEKPQKPTLKLAGGKLTVNRIKLKKKNASPESSPEPDPAQLGREPSPTHEYVLADNPDIAVSVD